MLELFKHKEEEEQEILELTRRRDVLEQLWMSNEREIVTKFLENNIRSSEVQ